MDPYDTLSTREREVLELLEAGRSEREIAEELHVSLATLATYRERIEMKLHGR
jgi:DNA-binding NarL/FixJ family response regulator